MRFLLVVSVIAILLTSCKDQQSMELDEQMAAFDQLTENTIEVHDELMNEMSPIMDLQIEIDNKLESETLDETSEEALVAAKVSLEDAHDSMMGWMKDYSQAFPYEAEAPSTKAEIDDKMPVLEEFYQDIKRLKEKTDKAIKEASEALATN